MSNATVDGMGSIKTALSIYFPIFLCGILLYEIIRKYLPNVYETRNRSIETTCNIVKNPMSIFKWFIYSFKITDNEVLEQCGLEALLYLRFQRLGQKIGLCSIFLSFIICPIYYYYGKNSPNDSNDFLFKTSIGNISSDKNQLPLISTVLSGYLLNIYLMYLLYNEYKIYILYRHKFFKRKNIQQYSITINDLPLDLRTNKTLKNHMEYIFPNQIRYIYIAVECTELENKINERKIIQAKLEHALVQCALTGKRQKHKVNKIIVDSVNEYEKNLSELNLCVTDMTNDIKSRQKLEEESTYNNNNNNNNIIIKNNSISKLLKFNINKRESINRSTAFVCFTSLKAVHISQQCLQDSNPASMIVGPAPDNDDIIWSNVGISFAIRSSSRIFSYEITALIVFFWTIPTAFVSSLFSLNDLSKKYKFIKNMIEDYPWTVTVAEQLAPILLIVMASLVGILFNILSRKERLPSESETNGSFFIKITCYAFIQTFFVSFITSSIMSSLNELAENPTQTLGKTLSSRGGFFTVYIIVQTNIGYIIELLRVIPMLFAFLHSKIAPQLTARERRSPWYFLYPISLPGSFEPTSNYADNLLILMIMLTFSIIYPLSSYFGWFYFLVSDVITRRQVFYIYDPIRTSPGIYWPKIFLFIIFIMIVSQMTLIGILGIKQSAIASTIATILPIITIIFFLYITSLFPRIAKNLPLTDCVQLDYERKAIPNKLNDQSMINEKDETDPWSFLDNAYIQPAIASPLTIQPEYNPESMLYQTPVHTDIIQPTSV